MNIQQQNFLNPSSFHTFLLLFNSSKISPTLTFPFPFPPLTTYTQSYIHIHTSLSLLSILSLMQRETMEMSSKSSSSSRISSELQIPKKWKDRDTSPERTKVWTEPNKPKSDHKKVSVVYYISRNGQLEHPHFMEVPLSSPQGLYLKGITFSQHPISYISTTKHVTLSNNVIFFYQPCHT